MASYQFPTSVVSHDTHNDEALLAQLLTNRNLIKAEEIVTFLEPNYQDGLHDPWLLHDMPVAVERIQAAMQAGEQIAIYSDYDCDGIPGAVVMHDYFKAIKYEQFQNYIPHRHYEGFGLNVEAINKLHDQGVTLIITIDCGTSDTEAIAHAKTLGIDVIVTDHHEPPTVLPEAVAIVNPKLGSYPFTELCGAAVIFKVVQALLSRGGHDLVPGYEKWWLDMVGIATIADMVPLLGENRILAHYGLQVLRKSRRPGLQYLLHKTRVNQAELTEEDVGFTIGPRINAASRMDTPEDAFLMLAETDVVAAKSRVDHLEKLNQTRKTSVALMTKDLHKRLELIEVVPEVLVLGNPEWRPALVGLAASKLAEEHQKPVFLWGRDGNGIHKGSCRSGGGVSVVSLMEACSEVFLEHGGHHFSGGFAVRDEYVHTFGEALNTALKELGTKAAVTESKLVDAMLSLDMVRPSLVTTLSKLAPYGMANPKPLFAFPDVSPVQVGTFGKANEHVKLVFDTGRSKLEAIAFFAKPTDFTQVPELNRTCTVLGHVEQSSFMGRTQLRIRIIDIV